MAYLIDGFNLIYKFPELEEHMYAGNLDEARRGLLELLSRFSKIKKAKIRVVFDGKRAMGDSARREKTRSGIDVYYSQEYSADHLIKEFIKKDPNPRMATVVTSDNGIIFYINRFKPGIIKSEDFAKTVSAAIAEDEAVLSEKKCVEKETDPRLSPEEISFWEKLFRKKS